MKNNLKAETIVEQISLFTTTHKNGMLYLILYKIKYKVS